MKTKTFSGRADAEKLAFADSLTRQTLGISFGQYCSAVLLDAVFREAKLPQFGEPPSSDAKAAAVEKLKSMSESFHNEQIGAMTDAELREMIASRYE